MSLPIHPRCGELGFRGRLVLLRIDLDLVLPTKEARSDSSFS
jgi:hypothetical protein